jgi:tRNA threonylcarbamoyladenosine biosynthesis protein TsaE
VSERRIVYTNSPEDTFRLGEALGRVLQTGNSVLLSGTLGAGKTLFSKGVAKGAGVTDEVTSPTFTLVAEYEANGAYGSCLFVHMDLYRLYGGDGPTISSKLSSEALDSIDFESYLDGSSIILAEWPQGIMDYFDEAILINLKIPEDELPQIRVILVETIGIHSEHQVDEWVKQWQS